MSLQLRMSSHAPVIEYLACQQRVSYDVPPDGMSCSIADASSMGKLCCVTGHGHRDVMLNHGCLPCAEGLRVWKGDGVQRTPDLHFTYEEEAAAEDFFVPYIWTLVVSSTSLPWNSRSISLFAPSGQDGIGGTVDLEHSSSQQLDPAMAQQPLTSSEAEL